MSKPKYKPVYDRLRERKVSIFSTILFRKLCAEIIGETDFRRISVHLADVCKRGTLKRTGIKDGVQHYTFPDAQELKPEPEPERPKDELNYEQIGKAIMARMDELKQAELDCVSLGNEIRHLKLENKKLLDKLAEKQNTIQKLNIRISQMNLQQEQGKTFKMADIARVK